MSFKRKVLLVAFVYVASLGMLLAFKFNRIVMSPEQAASYVEEPFFSWKDLVGSLILAVFFLVLMWRLEPSVRIRELGGV